ncbi:hypothetical protein K1719_001986 [Acacia pycnantha]|nr:hypothetical protein K1719_001986 [Acacia pycnantha]
MKTSYKFVRIANEQECITRITNEVATRINQEPLHVTNYPVGLVPRVKEVISYLDLWSTKKIKMIGIWGAGGIGKSTIARALYNSIADNFEGLCFLSHVRKRSKEPNGLSHLQETLLAKLVIMAKDLNFGDYHEGIPIIQRRLSQKKILLILDDVDESNQLKALAGSCNWFGSGSRIIITTKDKQLLKSHGIESIYDVKGLNSAESLELLSWYAFKKENVDSNYVAVCNRATDYSCGFPLALEVMGSNLRGKGVNLWSSALDQFKRRQERTIFNTLKLSYHMLEQEQKQVFLDLACFFNGEKLANIIDILLCVRAIEPKYAIDTLIDKSLIKIEQERVTMHDLIEDVGKEIVRQDSPGKQSRLWFYQDILQVLQQDTGTNKVEAIILDLLEVHPTQLVYLDLSNSSCKFLQPSDKKFPNLSRMNLRNCKFLQHIPNLSGASNLTELWLDGCTNLTEIHDSVGCLNKLRELSAMRCKNLKILPSRLRLTSLEHLNLFGCLSLQTFPEVSIVMKAMQTLDLDKTKIIELPSSVRNLIGLETLSVEECPNLKQLPASICTLPSLWMLRTKGCEGLSHFKMREGGDEASLYCSAMSLKMELLCFSNCNLSDDFLAFCLSHFTNMIHLDLSFNNFTTLPKCIEKCHNLKYLLLDHCIKLKYIGGMPPNLDQFSAICCTSLTESSKRKVFNEASNIQPGKRNFILPGNQLPKGLHYYNQGSSVSFWVRYVFPMASLWILFKDHRHHVSNYEFSVRINDTKVDIFSSMWLSLSRIVTDHIYICDMQSIILNAEIPLKNKWNQVEISFESEAKEIYFGVHLYNLQHYGVQFKDPRRYNNYRECNVAKDKNPNGDTESDAAKNTNPNGDAEDFPNEQSNTIKNKKRHQRWLRIFLYVVSVLLGQSAATLLGRLYYQEGGNSKWLGTLVQLVGFPILLPLYFIPASIHPSVTNTINNHEQSSMSKRAIVYVVLGLLVALNSYLYSVGLSYLPVSTYSLICSSQLAFNAFFSFFLNSLIFTPNIINSLVLLTISSVLLVFHTDPSSGSTQASKHKYMIGFICTVAASAGYGLVLSLTQLAFKKVFKKESFKVILDLIIYQSLVSTMVILVGLFASGEFRSLKVEMKEYGMGKASYVLNLSFTAISFLFSNVTSVLGVPIIPILAIVIFHDKMNGLKVISLLLALWGFLSYIYQQYLDETNSKTLQHTNNDSLSRDSQNGISGRVETGHFDSRSLIPCIHEERVSLSTMIN